MVGIDAATEQQKLTEFISPVAPEYIVFKAPEKGSKQASAKPLGVIGLAREDNRLAGEYKNHTFEAYEGKFDNEDKLLEKGPSLGYSAISLTGKVFRTIATEADLIGYVHIDSDSDSKSGSVTIFDKHDQPIGFVNYVTGGIYKMNNAQDPVGELVGFFYPPEQIYSSTTMKEDVVAKEPSVQNLIVIRRRVVGGLAAAVCGLLN